RYRLAELQARLDYLTKHRAATVRRAQFARVALELATKPKHRAAASTGRFDRTMSDAGGVLLREAEILVYALIVAGPLLLLGGSSAHRRGTVPERGLSHLAVIGTDPCGVSPSVSGRRGSSDESRQASSDPTTTSAAWRPG